MLIAKFNCAHMLSLNCAHMLSLNCAACLNCADSHSCAQREKGISCILCRIFHVRKVTAGPVDCGMQAMPRVLFPTCRMGVETRKGELHAQAALDTLVLQGDAT